MSKKKLEKEESVIVDVDSDVTSVSTTNVVNDAVDVGGDVGGEEKPKKSKKKVSEVALLGQISDLEDALSKAKDAVESASADNERLADELGVSVSENKSLRKELTKLKQDFKRVQGDNRANSALVDTLDCELARQKTRNKELMDSIANLQDGMRTKDKAISAKEAHIASLDAELSRYKCMSFFGRLKFLFSGYKEQ